MQPSIQGPRPWAYLSWPNRISLMRLIMVAPFFMLMQHHQARPLYRYLALGIFAFMAVSDLLDGFLARRLNRKTRLGTMLDPLADKTLIICAAVLLSLPHSCVPESRLPDMVVVMIVGKDLWIIVGTLVVFLVIGRVRVAPSLPGKLCTFTQILMVGFTLLSPEINLLGWRVGTHIAQALWWAVAALSGLAVVSYTRIGISFVAEADQNNSADHADKAA